MTTAMMLALIALVAIVLWVRSLPLGSRTLLYGVHCVPIHTYAIARAWHQLYGWGKVRMIYYPERRNVFTAETSLRDYRLWIAFIIHDWGYWGCEALDDAVGELHPQWAADKMMLWYGFPWRTFMLCHSRFLAKQVGLPPSPLCFADKVAITTLPAWLFLALARATGELQEYMAGTLRAQSLGEPNGIDTTSPQSWYAGLCKFVHEWVRRHRFGGYDSWTPKNRNIV